MGLIFYVTLLSNSPKLYILVFILSERRRDFSDGS